MQITPYLLMIRPVQFSFNAETAVNNAFQSAKDSDAHQAALIEFDNLVALLRINGLDVTVIEDTITPATPDSIFPNNWISFHEDGRIALYPMFATNRRLERKSHIIEMLLERFEVNTKVDFTGYEDSNLFLEGTGSMVLDRESKIIYACISDRTNPIVLKDFSLQFGFQVVSFLATDLHNIPIYHTNVMMGVADKYVIICLDVIHNQTERELVINKIHSSKKEIIEISLQQMNQFAGNMLQVQNQDGKKLLIMSSQAYKSLNQDQIFKLESYNAILHSKLDAIERNGGGSARCMIAEIFLPLRKHLN
jgi:hypothetical protein